MLPAVYGQSGAGQQLQRIIGEIDVKNNTEFTIQIRKRRICKVLRPPIEKRMLVAGPDYQQYKGIPRKHDSLQFGRNRLAAIAGTENQEKGTHKSDTHIPDLRRQKRTVIRCRLHLHEIGCILYQAQKGNDQHKF